MRIPKQSESVSRGRSTPQTNETKGLTPQCQWGLQTVLEGECINTPYGRRCCVNAQMKPG